MVLTLDSFVKDFATALRDVDAAGPVAVNQRSGAAFRPGIGPHTEANTIRLVVQRMGERDPVAYHTHGLEIRYPGGRQSCDLCFGTAPDWSWAIEVKMLRFYRDNGTLESNVVTKILSPYPEDHSALTDCTKLLGTSLGGRKAIVIFGYDYEGWPMDPAIDAFEVLAVREMQLGERLSSSFDRLVHPVHRCGRVFGWELIGWR